jgi:signal transduction histidine kinase/FixJ family two-component response regulator
MSTGVSRSAADVLDELEREKRARERALADVECQTRLVHSIERLCVAGAADAELISLLDNLLRVFVEVSHVDLVVIRLREGDLLKSRAAVGLEQEVASAFALSVDGSFPEGAADLCDTSTPLPGPVSGERPQTLHGHGIGFRAPGADAGSASDMATLGAPEPQRLLSGSSSGAYFSEPMRTSSMQRLCCLPLMSHGQLLGGLYAGSVEAREFSAQEQLLLRVLGTQATAAIARSNGIDELRHAIRSRDDVLSVVAHDLQNPINVISIAASMLLQRLPDATARRPLERIMRGVQRADRMIRDLLEVTSIESGRFSIQPSRVAPVDVILAALESQQSLAADASVIIASDLSPDLPSIEADEERLLEVLENLIGNAIKFTSAGGSVTVGASLRETDILVSVKDTGTGIAQDQLPHIFDRFWQAKKANRCGTGLGLTICKAIVEAHGGQIWASSEVDVGTTVSFTIPAPPAPSGWVDVPAVANILLVDDRPENLLALTSILERPDYRLVSASSGEEALRIALRESFAVALIDVAMPGMNGLEVAVHLKELERSRNIPIIFITAFGDDPEQIHRAYAAGGADYLVKPLDIEIVRKKVAVFVDLSRRRQEGETPAVRRRDPTLTENTK